MREQRARRRKKRIFIRFTCRSFVRFNFECRVARTHTHTNHWIVGTHAKLCCFNSNVIIERKRCRRRCHQSLPFSLSSSSPESTEFNYNFRTIGNSSNRYFVCLLKLNDVHCAMLSNLIVAAHSLPPHTHTLVFRKNSNNLIWIFFVRKNQWIRLRFAYDSRLIANALVQNIYSRICFLWISMAMRRTICRKRLNVATVPERLEHYLMPTMEIECACMIARFLSLWLSHALRICCLALIGGEVIRTPSVSAFEERAHSPRRRMCEFGMEERASDKWMLNAKTKYRRSAAPGPLKSNLYPCTAAVNIAYGFVCYTLMVYGLNITVHGARCRHVARSPSTHPSFRRSTFTVVSQCATSFRIHLAWPQSKSERENRMFCIIHLLFGCSSLVAQRHQLFNKNATALPFQKISLSLSSLFWVILFGDISVFILFFSFVVSRSRCCRRWHQTKLKTNFRFWMIDDERLDVFVCVLCCVCLSVP